MENTNEIITKVIQKIKNKRQSMGLSHENMAVELGISTSAYHKIEKQETKLTLYRLLQIMKILNLSFAELFDVKTEKIYNQNIKDNGVGHQEIENLYQDNKLAYEKHIASLENEIAFLRSLVKEKEK